MWKKGAILVVSAIICAIFDFYKYPFEQIKNLLEKIVLDMKEDEGWTWIPFIILCVIDIMQWLA